MRFDSSTGLPARVDTSSDRIPYVDQDELDDFLAEIGFDPTERQRLLLDRQIYGTSYLKISDGQVSRVDPAPIHGVRLKEGSMIEIMDPDIYFDWCWRGNV